MNSNYTMINQELLASERERNLIDSMEVLEYDVEKPTLLNVTYRGIQIGKLIVKTRHIEFEPVGNKMDIELNIRNITPITK